MYIKKTVAANDSGITDIVQLIKEQLKIYGFKNDEIKKTCLAAEEAAGSIAEHASEETMTVCIKGFFRNLGMEITSKGDKFSLSEIIDTEDLFDDGLDVSVQDTLRTIILKSMAERLRYRYVNGKNRVSFLIRRSQKAFLYQTLGSMALAIIVGMILSRFVPGNYNEILDKDFFVPVKTMYMNALKMVVAPVVFFSILSCIVQFSDINELGRLGGKILSIYMLTTLLATGVGIGSFYLFKPGGEVLIDINSDSVQKITSQTIDISVKDMIVNIVPSDFIQPFVESNMLQLIFLAIVCGIAAGMIGRYSEPVKEMFEGLNELFLRITTLVIKLMPVAVFCSISSMMLNMGPKAIASVFGIFATFVFGLLCMILIYCILMITVGHLNPLLFIKKYAQTMLQVFSMASSNASIPLNMEACKNLGIAQKLYSLSIPLGATVNMDGTCVYMSVFALSLAKIYGVEITGASLAAMIVSIIVLSVGAPGIPGSGLICLSVLLSQTGVPTEAIGLVMGIDSFVGMFRCMSNCTGDVAVSVAVAKKERLLDMDIYQSK